MGTGRKFRLPRPTSTPHPVFRRQRTPDGPIELADVQEALEEMVFRGGALNVKLLGGAAIGTGQGITK